MVSGRKSTLVFKVVMYGFVKDASICLLQPNSFTRHSYSFHPCRHLIHCCGSCSTLSVSTVVEERGPSGPFHHLSSCLTHTDIFPKTNRLLRTLITQPITRHTVERLFSTVSGIKTGIRASMITYRLNSVPALERKLTELLIYDESQASLLRL